MSNQQKEQLKQRVLEFVKHQEGYNPQEHERLDAFCENKETWGVTYGEDVQQGIAGFGSTPELAFRDFVRSWKELNGFTWIREQPTRIK